MDEVNYYLAEIIKEVLGEKEFDETTEDDTITIKTENVEISVYDEYEAALVLDSCYVTINFGIDLKTGLLDYDVKDVKEVDSDYLVNGMLSGETLCIDLGKNSSGLKIDISGYDPTAENLMAASDVILDIIKYLES